MLKLNIKLQIAISILITIMFVCLNKSYDFLAIPTQDTIQSISYNFFEVNSIMIGFCFSVLGMLFSFSNRSFVIRLKDTDIIVNKAKIIIHTMVFIGISSFSNLVIIIFSYIDWFKYIYIFSVINMIIGFIYFIKSMYNVYDLIKNINAYDKKENYEEFRNIINADQNIENENSVNHDTW